MRVTYTAAFALSFVTSTAHAAALTEQQVEGVQTAVRAAECTFEDGAIKAKSDGYKVNNAQCKDGLYDIFLDKDFKITKKAKEESPKEE